MLKKYSGISLLSQIEYLIILNESQYQLLFLKKY